MTRDVPSLDDQISLQKAVLWEEAKGKLRAVVAAGGQCRSTNSHHIERWRQLRREVDKFILEVEDNALHE